MSATPPRARPHRGRTYVMVETQVDLEDFDEEALVSFLEDRGYVWLKSGSAALGDGNPLLDRLHLAVKFNDERGLQSAVSDLLYQARGVIV